jgi:hypothetical protein
MNDSLWACHQLNPRPGLGPSDATYLRYLTYLNKELQDTGLHLDVDRPDG